MEVTARSEHGETANPVTEQVWHGARYADGRQMQNGIRKAPEKPVYVPLDPTLVTAPHPAKSLRGSTTP